MRYYPVYILAVSAICMLAILSYGHMQMNYSDILFGVCMGMVWGIALTLKRFSAKNVGKYGLIDGDR